MRRRFAYNLAQILILLAIVLSTIPVATAHSADAVLRTLAPPLARPGDEILITGENLLPAGGGEISSTIRYGLDPSSLPSRDPIPSPAIRGDLASSGWSSTRVRVRLPADIGPGNYWLAVFRNGALSSNRLLFTVQLVAKAAPITTPHVAVAGALSRALVIDGPDCSGNATIRVEGGPFRPGTDSGSLGRYRWREGTTGVEVRMDGSPTAIDFWNERINRVTVVSERQLEVQITRCFVIQPAAHLRAILPDGTRTNWVEVHR